MGGDHTEHIEASIGLRHRLTARKGSLEGMGRASSRMPEEREAHLESWGYSQEGSAVGGAGLHPQGIGEPRCSIHGQNSVGNWTEVEKETDKLPTHMKPWLQ